MARILVVASDPAIIQDTTHALASADFDVVVARAADDATRLAGKHFAAVLVDLHLADSAGRDLCHQLHHAGEGPIIALTRLLADCELLDGMDDGADEYLILPAERDVVIARVRSVLRRLAPRANQHQVRIRNLVIDQRRLQVTVAGREIGLTPTEFRLLTCLAHNAGRVMTCRELMREAQGYDCDEQEAQDIVKVHVNHLRQKIEGERKEARYIVNVRGFGYMLERRAPHQVVTP